MIHPASACGEEESPFISLFRPSSPSASPMSCGAHERFHIQRDGIIPESSFSWDDFPVLEQSCSSDHHDAFLLQGPQAPLHHRHALMCDAPAPAESSAPRSSPQTASSSSSSSSSKPNKKGKQVSFSECLEIRTHSVVLGNHPLCHFFPVELGWQYNDSEYINLDIYEQTKGPRRGQVPRLSFIERKLLLKHVGGVSEEELSRDQPFLSGTNRLRHSSSIHGDDTAGYGLASLSSEG